MGWGLGEEVGGAEGRKLREAQILHTMGTQGVRVLRDLVLAVDRAEAPLVVAAEGVFNAVEVVAQAGLPEAEVGERMEALERAALLAFQALAEAGEQVHVVPVIILLGPPVLLPEGLVAREVARRMGPRTCPRSFSGQVVPVVVAVHPEVLQEELPLAGLEVLVAVEALAEASSLLRQQRCQTAELFGQMELGVQPGQMVPMVVMLLVQQEQVVVRVAQGAEVVQEDQSY